MKKIFLLCAICVFAISCNDGKPETVTVNNNTSAAKTENTADLAANYNKAQFKIDGMTCAIGCAKRIESKLAAVDGVKSATVDFEQKLAMVEYNEAKVDFDKLTGTVAEVPGDYKVSEMKNVESFGKMCAADCKKDCCTKKGDAKKACAKDCKKKCCADKA